MFFQLVNRLVTSSGTHPFGVYGPSCANLVAEDSTVREVIMVRFSALAHKLLQVMTGSKMSTIPIVPSERHYIAGSRKTKPTWNTGHKKIRPRSGTDHVRIVGSGGMKECTHRRMIKLVPGRVPQYFGCVSSF